MQAGRFAVLFDLDGTLMNTAPGILESIRDTIRQMSLPIPGDDLLKAMIGPPIRDGFQRFIGLDEQASLQARDIFRTTYPDKHLFEAVVYPELRELLVDLRDRGFCLAVATSKPEWYAFPLLERFDLTSSFDFISGAKPGRETKREVLEDALHGLGCTDPAHAVLVGDTVYDRIGAATVGCAFLPVSWGYGFAADQDEPDLCRSVSELKTKLIMKGNAIA